MSILGMIKKKKPKPGMYEISFHCKEEITTKEGLEKIRKLIFDKTGYSMENITFVGNRPMDKKTKIQEFLVYLGNPEENNI